MKELLTVTTKLFREMRRDSSWLQKGDISSGRRCSPLGVATIHNHPVAYFIDSWHFHVIVLRAYV